MGLDRKSAAKLASLSALGAGALTLTADQAEAGIIYSGAIDLQIGCGCGGFSSSEDHTLVGLNQAVLLSFFVTGTYRSLGTGSSQVFRAVKGRGVAFTGTGSNRMQFQLGPLNPLADPLSPTRFMKLFPAGAVWPGNTSTGAGTTNWPPATSVTNTSMRSFFFFGVPVAHRMLSMTYSSSMIGPGGQSYPNPVSPTNHYALFSFSDATCGPGNTCYGWIDLGINLDPNYGPQVTVRSWAYDDSGAFLAAGEAPAEIPEPSTFALTGLAALALGAKGIRRWRAERSS